MAKMTNIPFAEWERLDLRVGQIKSVEDHPNADKLYILKVDLGTETRTLVAGIRKHYKKEDLMNKKVIVFTNLEPVVLRGIKSEGMILASVDEKADKVILISPEEDIANGSKVR